MTDSRFSSCTLPEMPAELEALWDVIFDLTDVLRPTGWVLVGGQMVMLHGLAAGRVATRASRDIDLLADLLSSAGAVGQCARAVMGMGFEPLEANERGLLHRFVRPVDQAIIDVLAPDHAPPNRKPVTVPPRTTIKIDGGRQALERAVVIQVAKDGRTVDVPVPSPLGALVLKGAAFRADNRDRARHANDAAFLVSLITDPIAVREQLKGSDRKRLRALDEVLADPESESWALLGDEAEDAIARWKFLVS